MLKLRTILLVGAAVMLPAAVTGAIPGTTISPQMEQFNPPSSPLRLTRTLYRNLADGKQVVVRRIYAIRIAAAPDGYRVDGHLVGAEVEAPPILASLAEIERKRPDEGIFPTLLDPSGMIRQGGVGTVDPTSRDQALVKAKAMISTTAMSNEAKQERVGVLNQVAAASSTSAWPVYLFNPGRQEHVEIRRVPLRDGGEGVVEVRVRAEGLLAGGMAQRVERIITTRLAGTVRVSREVWTIEVAAD